MKKIDRLGWAAGISFVSYGRRIGIRTNDPKIVDRLTELLPPHTKAGGQRVEHLYSLVVGGARRSSSARRYNLVYADAVRVARSMDLDAVLEVLESDLQLYVADMARRRVFVHAGVVGWNGRAIVIPGRSHSGKSTLVAALLEAGATYYSDEYAVLDERGRVHPYAKPLALRHESGGRTGKLQYNHEGGAGVKPLQVGLVVVTNHRAGARWRPRPMSQGRAIMALLAHTVSARRQPKRALAILPKVTAQAVFLKGVRGEAEAMIESLLSKSDEPESTVWAGIGRQRVAAAVG